jgi:hypothetical protein
VRESSPTNEDFEPILRLIDLILSSHSSLELMWRKSSSVSTSLDNRLFIPCSSSVIEEWNWLSESDVEIEFAIVLVIDLNVTHSFADIVEILRRLDDILD